MKERLQALGHQVSNTRHPYDFEVDIGSAEVANILSKALRVVCFDCRTFSSATTAYMTWTRSDTYSREFTLIRSCFFIDMLRRQKAGLDVIIKADRSELSDLPGFLDRVSEVVTRVRLQCYTDPSTPTYNFLARVSAEENQGGKGERLGELSKIHCHFGFSQLSDTEPCFIQWMDYKRT
ncbi:hypothetical protein PRIPAC_70818 [Pristionchus pacificus]|uniref:Uncharacterized protein n=1 Tax=Pristionchus pacificus TaxID=54126 RepID=A0A2A6CRS2_PRIPA|nr:hypothetical protein PRIPAC_70818 [Pristionchus pacificus]|eukprot:PDM80839.1 hypothetical protein PRIPAC_35842 [Pristionchus pacificus]